jgi:serine/threonine protein kinase
MPLASGTRLGSYEIVGALGAGGMGEVYRARDAKLNRDVAIKVLRSSARKELLFSAPDQRIMVASFSVDTDSFRPGKPRLWSPMRVATRFGSRSWDLHSDGRRV